MSDHADEAHHSEGTVFSGSEHPLTFGDSEDGGGGGLFELYGTHTPNTEAHSADGWNGSSASELRERSGASSSKTSEGGVECDLFPALSGRGQGSRMPITAKEGGDDKNNKANHIDSTFYHQKN